MAKIYFCLLEKTKNRHGNYSIYMTISHNRKLARYCTNVEIPAVNCWNAEKEYVYAKSNTPFSYQQNKELERLKRKADEAVSIVKERGEEITAKAIMDVFRKLETNTLQDRFSFLEFVEEAVESAYNNRQYALYRKYDIFCRRLKAFVNGVKPEDCDLRRKQDNKEEEKKKHKQKDLLFTDITYHFLTKYELFLHQLPNNCQKSLLMNQNSIKKEMGTFRALFMKGVNCKEDEGLKIGRNPFERYKCKGGEPKEKAKLSPEEIKALESLDLPEHSALWNARNCFLLSFYAGGIRFGDTIQLRGTFISKADDTYRLKYTMDKTGKEKNMLLIPEAIEILKKYIDLDNTTTDYVFPYLNNNADYAKAVTPEERDALSPDETRHLKQDIGAKNALVNKYLKDLAEMAGIDKHLCTHSARHSFADLARRNTGDIFDIKTILGHSSINTTQNYLKKLDTETQDKALQNVFHKEDELDALRKQLRQLPPDTLKKLLGEF